MPTRILIAEDNAFVRAAMRQVLEEVGHWEVIEAENGKEAVAKAQEGQPDLIVLDLVMPLMNGLTASREIADLLPGIPILVHTLHCSPEVELEALKVGVRRIIPKSGGRALVSAVEELLNSKPPASANTASQPVTSDSPEVMRRTEDTIRELCLQLFAAKDDQGLTSLIVELREALHRHVELFRARLREYPIVVERRVRDRSEQPAATPIQEVATREIDSKTPLPIPPSKPEQPVPAPSATTSSG